MINYWNETLENISKDQRTDKFNFIVNNMIYKVPLSFALGISPLIIKNYLKDPTFNEFSITLNKNECSEISEKEIHEEFSKFLKGEMITRKIFYEIGISLQNQEMIKQWAKSKEFKKETIIQSIKEYHTFANMNMKEELEYIGEHFEEMKEEIRELNDEDLILILKSQKIKVEKEDLIWEIVKERIQNKSQKNFKDKKSLYKSELMEAIEINYLKKKYLEEYVEMIEQEDIQREPKIFKKIKNFLVKNLNMHILPKEKINIQHKEGQDFEGIFKYLQTKFGKNLHEQGIISISASPTITNKPELRVNPSKKKKKS